MSHPEATQSKQYNSEELPRSHPNNWDLIALEDCISEFIDYRGKAPPKTERGIPLITARNVREGNIDFTAQEFIDSNKYHEWMVRGIPSVGDVLFTTEAPLGNACMYPEGLFAVAQRLITLKPDRSILDGRFLMYYLLSNEGKTAVQFRKSGSTATGIKQSELRKVEILLPPLNEQRKITEILSCWDFGIEKTLKQAEMLFKLKQTLISNLIESSQEGTLTKISSLAELNPSKEQISDGSLEVTFLGMADISESGSVIARARREYSKVRMGFTAFREQDVLLAKITPCFENGKCAIASNLLNGIGFGSTEFHVLRPNTGVDPRYLLFTIQGTEFRKKGISEMTGSAGQKRVPSLFLSNYQLHYPGHQRAASICDVIESVEVAARKTIGLSDLLRNQKQALMQKLLTGKIRVKV